MHIPDLKSKDLKEYISLSQSEEFVVSNIMYYSREMLSSNPDLSNDLIVDINLFDKFINVKYKEDITQFKKYDNPKTIVVNLIDFNIYLREKKFKELLD